jgi:hypothetical protein
VGNRSARHRDTHHVAARAVDGFAHSFGDFVRLARGESNATLTITDGNERVEGEATSTLHDFRDTVDGDHVLDELATAVAAATITVATFALAASTAALAALALAARSTAALAARRSATTPGARSTTPTAATTASTSTTAATPSASTGARPFLRRWRCLFRCRFGILVFRHLLELQPALAGSVGHAFHAAVIFVSSSVKNDARYAGIFCLRSKSLSYLDRSLGRFSLET